MALSKIDITALRKCDDLVVHLNDHYPTGMVRAIKRKPLFGKDPFATDIEHVVEGVAVKLESYRAMESFKAGGVKCFASISNYHQKDHTTSVLKLLKAGDIIEFCFCPDAHSNGYLASSRLHADVLKVNVNRNGKHWATFELTTSICPNNSARMVQGVPNSQDYDRQANDPEIKRHWA